MAATLVTRCTVRPAHSGDADRVSAFGRRVFAVAFAPDNDPLQLERYLATAYTPEAQATELADPAVTTLLACDAADALLGFAQLRRSAAPPCVTQLPAIELWRFYVDQAWHGRGVAARMMQAVQDTASGCGARTLWLGVWERNPRAQAFYRKAGFRPVGTQCFILGTEPQTDQIWMRALQ